MAEIFEIALSATNIVLCLEMQRSRLSKISGKVNTGPAIVGLKLEMTLHDTVTFCKEKISYAKKPHH